MPGSAGASAHEHSPLAVAELHGVVDERAQHLSEAIRIGPQGHPRNHLDLDRDGQTALVPLPYHRGRGANGVLEGHVGHGEDQRLAVAHREIDDRLDDPVEIPGGHLDITQRVELRGILPYRPAHLDEVAETEDRGERRAQLVLHRREEVRLHGVELTETAHRLTLQLVETRILHRDRRVVGKNGKNTLDIGVGRRGVRWRHHRQRADHLAAV